ncbi:alpha/beta-hydrolase [Rhizophagus irregularis]|uniref:Alpha/beta-hydrolase n=1 Tax=Rhizophagus irregularis TaxID=588596 RepID=A0A2I1EN35_9GLOM|nr:alpha/beta-hydrolase [Rhizophagus irregularis]PKC62615.1 alpha/beta-hydrolase [Rhizophagus irregularis]PKK76571.1 alpha/beta-hydrolase [Rhizophagus irregularis]PKY23515.1 alpha/beta-hydrolase [Rhizophagus irregularis]
MTISGVALLYNILQRELLYPSNWPMGSRKFVSKPSEYGIPYSEIKLFTKDNVRLRAFVCKQPIDREAKKRPTIIMFHGNGGNMGHRLPIARIFYLELNYNVILLSYRGYGRSEGTPAEKGLRIDAQTVLDYVSKHEIFKETKIIIYGQSLGGAVAIDLVSKNESKVSALIIENTFLSILIPHLIPKFSFLRYFSFLCWQNWRSENSIQKIKFIPILFLSGTKDEIIPQEHMKGLFELTKTSGGKEWLEFSNGNHNNTNSQPGYFQYIRKFVKRYIDLDEA